MSVEWMYFFKLLQVYGITFLVVSGLSWVFVEKVLNLPMCEEGNDGRKAKSKKNRKKKVFGTGLSELGWRGIEILMQRMLQKTLI